MGVGFFYTSAAGLVDTMRCSYKTPKAHAVQTASSLLGEDSLGCRLTEIYLKHEPILTPARCRRSRRRMNEVLESAGWLHPDSHECCTHYSPPGGLTIRWFLMTTVLAATAVDNQLKSFRVKRLAVALLPLHLSTRV